MLNWRNAADYLFPQDFPDYRWAWEFLRRNPAYQEDWKAALLRFQGDPNTYIKEFIPRARLALLGEDWNPDPGHPSFYLEADERKKWGLSGLVNPATDSPFFLRFDLEFGYISYKKEGAPVERGGRRYPWAYFDLYLPLKPQIEAVGRALEFAQSKQGIKPRRSKHHRKLWPLYLRLLDADLDDRTPKQIADVLEPENSLEVLDEKKVWDRLRAARKMTRPEGYLSIFLSPSPSEYSGS